MAKISSSRSTLAIPVWLTAAAVVLLGIRIAVKAYDLNMTEKERSVIAWHEADYLNNRPPQDKNKLVFIDFSATWCGPCQRMIKTTFLDRDVVKFFQDNFVAIRIDIPGKDDDKTAESPAAVKLQNLYQPGALPSFVIALPDGRRVEENAGFADKENFLKFLKDGIDDVPYAQAVAEVLKFNYGQALTDMSAYQIGSKSQVRSFLKTALYWHILKCLGRSEEAKHVAQLALQSAKDNPFNGQSDSEYPLPQLKFMDGEMSAQDLVNSGSKMHYYYDSYNHLTLALASLQKGDRKDAMTEFKMSIGAKFAYADEASRLSQRFLEVLETK